MEIELTVEAGKTREQALEFYLRHIAHAWAQTQTNVKARDVKVKFISLFTKTEEEPIALARKFRKDLYFVAPHPQTEDALHKVMRGHPPVVGAYCSRSINMAATFLKGPRKIATKGNTGPIMVIHDPGAEVVYRPEARNSPEHSKTSSQARTLFTIQVEIL